MKHFFLCFYICLSCSLSAQTKLGLKFTDPEFLEGIPLASTPFSGEELPSKIDLSTGMPIAGDQGNQGSCVAWAIAYACKSYQESLEDNTALNSGAEANKNAVFSPAFVYNQINDGLDQGSLFTDALNILSQQGAVKWVDMPYKETDFLTKPEKTQLDKAKKYRIDFWRRVNIKDIKEVKAQLNAGYPVIIGVLADKGFVDDGWAATGTKDYLWKAAKGEQLGGHAMLVVGYDDSKNAFKVLNSWGTGWGNKGYCQISYLHFPKVVREGYVMKDAINPKPATTTKPATEFVNTKPLADLNAGFDLTNVTHNIPDYQMGLIMRFDGTVNVPKGVGKTMQIVIRFYLNDGNNGKGMPVGSYYPQFMMPDGSAACGAPKVNADLGSTTWYANLPYETLDVPRGGYNNWGQYQTVTSYLVAEAVLYIDDFAVSKAPLIPFYVNL